MILPTHKHFPRRNRILGQIDDTEILWPMLQPGDSKAEWMRNNYQWYYWIGWCLRIESALEIGIYKGYSAYALLATCATPYYLGIDDGSYRIKPMGALEQLKAAFVDRSATLRVLQRDSQEMLPSEIAVWAPGGGFDAAHVDGNHSYHGALHDMELVRPHVRAGGTILVDDVLIDHNVMQATEEFAFQRDLPWLVLPTNHGLAVIFV